MHVVVAVLGRGGDEGGCDATEYSVFCETDFISLCVEGVWMVR